MIVLEDVRKHYGALEVIKGVSAEVTKGEVVCVIGPSGSGKSTLLRCINGLEAYDGGEIRVDGQRVDRDKRGIKAIRTRVSMVFQRFNLFANRTALENVVEGPIHVKGEPRGEAEERARALLARVGLSGKEDQSPHLLSGGEKQMLALASVTALEPAVIVADEPTGLLDLVNRNRLRRRFDALPQQLIVVTHDLELAADADRTLCIDDGRIIDDGSPAEVISGYIERMERRALL